MADKPVKLAFRTAEISDEERAAARNAIHMFNKFLSKLDASREQDNRLLDVLKANQDADQSALFEQRHLIRRYQDDVKQRYTDLIFDFAGKKEGNYTVPGIIHIMKPLEKDTKTRQIKTTLEDAMSQLSEYMEEFLKSLDDYENKNQIKSILYTSDMVDKLIKSIKNIFDSQLKPHFDRNVLKKEKFANIRGDIKKRARIISLLEKS